MAEKPRLKETGEIFSSIGRGTAKTPPLPVMSQEPASPPAHEQEPDGSLIESLLQDTPKQPAPRQKKRSSGDKRSRRPQQEAQDKDPSPLDFEKYKLPSKSDLQTSSIPAETPPEKGSIPTTEQLITALPKMRRVNPLRPAGEKENKAPSFAPPIPRPKPQPKPEPQPQPQPFIFPHLEEEPSAGQAAFIPQSQPPKVVLSAKQEPAKTEKPPEGQQKAEDVFRQLSSRFDEAFSQAFERKGEDSRGASAPKRGQSFPAEKPSAPQQPLPEEDLHAQRETDSFLQEFRQQVREEEEVRTELFKDTLAEKFERERERYLKELGINRPPQPEATAAPHPPAIRRLDVQIDPQMHMQREEGPVPGAGPAGEPVTYSPTGAIRSLRSEPEEEPPPSPQPPQGHKGRRSAEELLLELGRQNKPAGNRPPPRPMETATPKVENLPSIPPAAPWQEERPKKKKSNRRLIALSSGVALVLLLVFLVPVALGRLMKAVGPEEPSSAFVPNESGGKDMTIYENRNPVQREECDNLIIKKSNVKVQNFSVRDNVLIQNIESEGSIHLEDISIGGELRLGAGGVDHLVLRNVSANRLVINNSKATVKVELEGQGAVNTIEIRTPVTLDRTLSQGADGESIQQVILRATQEVGVLDVTLNGLEIRNLTAEPATVLQLGKDTVVEQLTGEGSLSLSGEGQILNMAIQPADLSEKLVLHLGTRVGTLSVKGQSQMTVDRTVNSLILSEDTSISGSGEIHGMILSPPVNWHRLQLKVDGVSVHNLIADADSTLQVTGSGRVMELRANASVYALGNKVNVLFTNADGVIYEEEPDRLVTMAGIHPPGSVADYPNLDYSTTSLNPPENVDTDLDDVSTVCGHARESGGFLKGDGSAESPYLVSTAAQLAHVSKHLDSHFYQTGEIDIADDPQFASGFPVIGGQTPFSGSYDGGGYGISNLRIQSPAEQVGLFAANEGRLQNIVLRSGEIRSNAATRSYVGGIVGINRPGGTITACSNGTRVTGGASSSIGGICGYNDGAKIRDCYNAAKVSGSPLGGGLVGVNGKGSTLSGCYNVGTIEEGSAVAGQNADGGVITNCYYLAETAPAGIGTGSGSATLRNSDEMSSRQMVADLNAGRDVSPWEESSGSYTYPLLQAPASPAFLTEGEES